MPIHVTCPACRTPGVVPDSAAGGMASCVCGCSFAVALPQAVIVTPQQPFDFQGEAHGPPVARQSRPVVIERTGKFWKAQMLLGAILAIVGAIVICSGAASGNRPTPGLAAASLAALGVGLVWFTLARIMAWWHHG